jgi:RNA polymerase sigma factor (sigma-70 family)
VRRFIGARVNRIDPSGVVLGVQAVPIVNVQTFDDFYADHYGRALGLAWTLTGSRFAAEELVQDAFVEVMRRWSTISGYDDPSAYLRRVVATRSVSRWRSAQREARAMLRLGGRRREPAEIDQPYDGPLWDLVRSLPRLQAQVVALHYVEELTVVEIAGVLGVNQGTVKSSLFRARQSLANQMPTHGDDQ